MESGFTSSSDEFEDVALLEAQRLHDSQDALDEATPFGTIRCEAQLPPDDRMTNLPLDMVVRWLDSLARDEDEEDAWMADQRPFAMTLQLGLGHRYRIAMVRCGLLWPSPRSATRRLSGKCFDC